MTAILAALLLASPEAAAQQDKCKGTRSWFAGKCRYPDEIKRLTRRKRTGKLVVEATTEGARVKISGPGAFSLTRVLPVTVARAPRGSYHITVNRTGFHTETRTEIVRAGKTTLVTVALVRSTGKANIRWVAIHGGSYMMGSTSGDKDERPVHAVTVKTFSMMKTEVTVAHFRACVVAGVCTKPDSGGDCSWGQTGRDNHPVNCVSWDQSRAFCRWVSGRLPSEAQWEYAARSLGRAWTFPWGNEKADCVRSVMGHTRKCTAADPCGCGKNRTWSVCSRVAGNTTQGLCDMAGNVWEWTEDCHHKNYIGAPSDGSAWTKNCVDTKRMFRGGGWSLNVGDGRAASRNWDKPKGKYRNLGLRCIK